MKHLRLNIFIYVYMIDAGFNRLKNLENFIL
jgi:hypothetical protein